MQGKCKINSIYISILALSTKYIQCEKMDSTSDKFTSVFFNFLKLRIFKRTTFERLLCSKFKLYEFVILILFSSIYFYFPTNSIFFIDNLSESIWGHIWWCSEAVVWRCFIKSGCSGTFKIYWKHALLFVNLSYCL